MQRPNEMAVMPILELREVTVVRAGTPILDSVSLSLLPGQHTAILGPNGSGKSTLVQLITGQIYPSAPPSVDPPIRVFGRTRWNLEKLRTRLGVVSADLHHRLVSGSSLGRSTATEAVVASFFGSESLFLHHEVLVEYRDRALDALAEVGADHLANRRLHTMSTGEARRVLIARALVHRPEVLVLDEPTTGLDLVARERFLSTLRDLAANRVTVVLVTHQVEEVLPEIERVMLMSRGRIVADGDPAAVLTSNSLSTAFESPVILDRRAKRLSLRVAD